MHAIFFNEHGDINLLKYGQVNDPTIENEYAIIKVLYSSINHLDLWVLNGWPGLKLDLPHIGGSDVVGKIVEVPKNTKDFSNGDIICANPGYLKPGDTDNFIKLGKEQLSRRYGILGETCKGSLAEFIKVPLRSLYKVNHIPESELSSLTASLLVGLTSYRMLHHRAQIKSSDTVLIVGGGGGVNSFSIKLSKYFGAKVIALTSTDEKVEFCKKIGADHVLNYKSDSSWSKKVKELTEGYGADIVIDNVGEKTINESIRACKNEGKIITVGNTSGYNLQIDNRLIFSKQISIIGSTMGSFSDFENILGIILKEKIYAPICKNYSLSDGIEAFKLLKSGDQAGKIVINVT